MLPNLNDTLSETLRNFKTSAKKKTGKKINLHNFV